MKYVILGSSAAGINAAREIRSLDKDARITLISKDKQIYSRCILHHYLGDLRTVEELNFAEPDFESRYQVEWLSGTEAIGLYVEGKQVLTDVHGAVPYEKLLIATGSHTRKPPVPGLEQADNAIGFRNLEDIDYLKEVGKAKQNIVIIGAGLVGLDCTCGLLELGIQPVIVEMEKRPVKRQLDERAANAYEKALAKRGVKQYYQTAVNRAVTDESHNITALELSDGSVIPCDLLILTTGVRPNVEFLRGSAVKLDRYGLWYDEQGQTSVPDIYGAGDVSGKAPIWPVAVKEGIVAGGNMAGDERRMTDFFSSKSTMNFQGIPTMSLGCVEPEEEGYHIEVEETDGSYKKIIHKGGRITGAILQGDLSYGGVLQQLIIHRIDVSKVKKPIFEIDYSDFFHMDDNFEYYYEEKKI